MFGWLYFSFSDNCKLFSVFCVTVEGLGLLITVRERDRSVTNELVICQFSLCLHDGPLSPPTVDLSTSVLLSMVFVKCKR